MIFRVLYIASWAAVAIQCISAFVHNRLFTESQEGIVWHLALALSMHAVEKVLVRLFACGGVTARRCAAAHGRM